MAHEQSDFLFLQQYAQPPDSSYCSRYTVTSLDYSSNVAQLLAAESSWKSTFECGDIGDDDVEERSSLHVPSFLQQDSISHDDDQYFSLGGDIQFDFDPSTSLLNTSTHHHDYTPNYIEDGLVDIDYSSKSVINHVFPTPLLDSSISRAQQSVFSTPSTFSNHEPSYDSNDMIVDLNVVETTSFPPKANSISPSSILATKVYNIEPCDEELGMKMIMKRPRMEMPSPMPTFKVRKEKLGDRVTALQQLVSPFGKNDTASVLHEATKYIKFLHNQVLSATNISDGNPIQEHQVMNRGRWDRDRKSSGLRSRGLCLVPISTTFQIANESSSPNYWTTMFEGPFR